MVTKCLAAMHNLSCFSARWSWAKNVYVRRQTTKDYYRSITMTNGQVT